jgi:L-2-hydroxycarboxylate dehydrogenase (NAD+)
MSEAAAPAPPGRTVSEPALRGFIGRVLVAAGLPADDADAVAELMARADATGADGHGVFRLPQYVRRIRAGGIQVRPAIRVARESTASAVLDGDDAMGHLVMRRATELAIAKARAHGIGWVGAFGSNHAGPAALYVELAAESGLIGIYLAVGSANHVAPWGSIDPLLSTNPIAIAVPGGPDGPVLLDMATTVAAYGKVKMAAQRGETMPEGWMIDGAGRPITDPSRAGEGTLLPIGGYKGYGLSLMIGLLAGTLNGAAMGSRVVDFNADDATRTNTGQAILAIDPAAFGDPAVFLAEVERIRHEMTSAGRLPGVERIRLPGDGRAETRRARRIDGIPIPAPLQAALDRLADGLGVAPLADPSTAGSPAR